MSDNNIQKNYSNLIINNDIVKHYVNGISRFLILWIIKYNKSIHGYGILKELNEFFPVFIEDGSLKKSNASKIYPILDGLEKSGLIESEFKTENNKERKYFKITADGEYVLNYIYSRMDFNHYNEQWKSMFKDMS